MAAPQSTMARIFNTLCLFLQIAGLGTAIAGVAILQQNCNNYNDGYNFNGIFGLGPNMVTDMLAAASGGGRGWDHRNYDCGMQYSWYWWVLALELVCICAGILANFTSLRRGKQCIISFYSTSSALWCIFAYAMLWAVYLYQASSNASFKDNKWAQGYACGGAGAIAVLVGNFIFLMIFGWDSSDVTVEVTKGDTHTGFQAA